MADVLEQGEQRQPPRAVPRAAHRRERGALAGRWGGARLIFPGSTGARGGVRGGGGRPAGPTRPLVFDVLRNDARGGREVPRHELDQFTNDLSYLYPPAKRATKFLSLCKFAQEKAVRVRKWLAQGIRADSLPEQIARMTVC